MRKRQVEKQASVIVPDGIPLIEKVLSQNETNCQLKVAQRVVWY